MVLKKKDDSMNEDFLKVHEHIKNNEMSPVRFNSQAGPAFPHFFKPAVGILKVNALVLQTRRKRNVL